MFIQVEAITTEIMAVLTKPVPGWNTHCEVGRWRKCRMSSNRPYCGL
jgi:hypothetical protein